jgi:hypothetical protein
VKEKIVRGREQQGRNTCCRVTDTERYNSGIDREIERNRVCEREREREKE